MIKRARQVVLLTGLAVAMCASVAQAQSSDVITELRGDTDPWMEGVPLSAQRAARLLFLSGNQLIDQSLFGKAAGKYRQALELWAHPAFYYNLAIAQINLEQPIEAYENFQRALRYGHEPLSQAKYKEGKNYLILLEGQLARLELTCSKRDARVSLDGAFVLNCPGAHRVIVRPGSHQIIATKADGVPQTEDITLAPGERRQHEVKLDRLVPRRRWAVWKPWAVLAAGTATMLGAGYVNWRASVQFGDIEGEFDIFCSTGCKGLPVHLSSQMRRAERRQRYSLAFLGIAGAAVATGVVLLYLNQERWVVVERDETAGMVLIPSFGPDSGQIHAIWRF